MLKKINFKNSELIVFESVYLPREDSFLLTDNLPKKEFENKKVLDLGCGSGIQGINASLNKAKSVLSVDINPKALENALENSKNFNLNNITVLQSNLFENIQEKFDVIVFNPPYLPSEEKKELELDGGKNGSELIEEFIPNSINYLEPKGKIFILISSLNNFEAIESIFDKNSFNFFVVASENFFFEEIRVYCLTKK